MSDDQKPKRKRPPRTDKVRQQDRMRQQAAEDRKRERAKELGMRQFKGEIYKATSERLEAIVAKTGAEEIEVVVNLLHRAFELMERDPAAFEALTSHKPLPEVWHG
ncbi:hypothetical protein [Pseudomonas monsensis]|uniref:hypothetical protein n=1 Tax=Pseudomonas monsensis TaxID=2745509 RepID=UPI003D1F3607